MRLWSLLLAAALLLPGGAQAACPTQTAPVDYTGGKKVRVCVNSPAGDEALSVTVAFEWKDAAGRDRRASGDYAPPAGQAVFADGFEFLLTPPPEAVGSGVTVTSATNRFGTSEVRPAGSTFRHGSAPPAPTVRNE